VRTRSASSRLIEMRSASGRKRAVASLRRNLGNAAIRAAWGPVGGKLPRHYVRSIVERATMKPVSDHLVDMELLEAATVERFAFSSDLGPSFRRSIAVDDRYVYRLKNVCVSPRSGLAWLPDGTVLGESFGSLVRLLGWGNAALDDPMMKVRNEVDGPAIAVGAKAPGYYHWVLEDLPLILHARERVPDVVVLTPPEAPTYVTESLAAIPGLPTLELEEPVFVKDLVLVGRVPFVVPQGDVAALRARFRTDDASRQRAVFVTRRHQSRVHGNEADVEAALEEIGVEVIAPETLSFTQQIDRFAGVDLLIGGHGGGLTNLLWSQAKGLVEVLSPEHFNDCYGRLASATGASYRPLYSHSDTTSQIMAPIEGLLETVGAFAGVADDGHHLGQI
jgi:Glycosyltransferase 61